MELLLQVQEDVHPLLRTQLRLNNMSCTLEVVVSAEPHPDAHSLDVCWHIRSFDRLGLDSLVTSTAATGPAPGPIATSPCSSATVGGMLEGWAS